MYGAPWRDAYDGQFHDWPTKFHGDTVSKLAIQLVKDHRIQEGDTVVGTSLGGIVACEIANQIELKKIVLIGSATRKEEISAFLSLLHPLVDLAPLAFVKAAAGKSPGELAEMFTQSDPQFIRSMCRAVFHWNGLQSDTPVHRIHGKRDRVIPPPEFADRLVDGGHLIVMTHPLECIASIQERNKD